MIRRETVYKTTLIVFGVLLALALVEAGFRTAGGLLSIRQEIRNRRGLSDDRTYRILCLGESTTQEQWPPLLQEELDKNDLGIKFKVIDKGKRGTFTGVILRLLEGYLDQFNPQMVVVMMGINDGEWVWKNPVEYINKYPVNIRMFLQNTRLNKLMTYIKGGLRNKRPRDRMRPPARISPPEERAAYARREPVRIKPDAGDPESYIVAGKAYREEGEYAESEKTLKKALSLFPRNHRVYIELGKLHRAKADFENAEKSLFAAAEIAPDDPSVLVERGNLQWEMGFLDSARRLFASGIEKHPANPQFYENLGKLLCETGDYAEAEIIFQQGVRAAPGDAQSYENLGQLFHQNGNYKKARRTYLSGLEAAPKDPQLYFNLAKLYFDTQEYEKAEKTVEAGFSADAGNSWLYIALGELYHHNAEFKNAERYYKKAVETAPWDQWVYVQLRKLYREIDAPAGAEDLYLAGIKASPKGQWAYIGLGELYEKKGDTPKYLELLRAAINADPGNPEAYIDLGNAYLALGETERAMSVFSQGIKAAPKSHGLYLSLGEIYGRRGQPEKEIDLFMKGISANPRNPWIILDLAKQFRQMGDTAITEKIYRAGIKANPRNPWLYKELAAFYYSAHQYDKAAAIMAQQAKATGGAPRMKDALTASTAPPHDERIKLKYGSISYPPLQATHNYQKLRDVVLGRGLRLVCMQYPMRDPRTLREILGNDERIIFIDNKSNFESALQKHALTDVFTDMFAGDFGHCTTLGNRLIAKNLADAILREVAREKK